MSRVIVTDDKFSISAHTGAPDSDLRAEYLAQLGAPMDDMWAAFADMAEQHDLLLGEELAGTCCVDGEGRLLRFYVRPRFQDRSTQLL